MEYKGIFETTLIDRTLEILHEYTGNMEDTLLLNCCTGLLIIPKQKLHDSLSNEEITETDWGIDKALIKKETNKSIKKTVSHIRNAISHGGFEFGSESGEVITHVLLRDWPSDDHADDKTNFELQISIASFKKFVLKFAEFASDHKSDFID